MTRTIKQVLSALSTAKAVAEEWLMHQRQAYAGHPEKWAGAQADYDEINEAFCALEAEQAQAAGLESELREPTDAELPEPAYMANERGEAWSKEWIENWSAGNKVRFPFPLFTAEQMRAAMALLWSKT